MDSAESYWRSKAMEASQEYDMVLESQREEIAKLQYRCNELLHERSLMKAATAADVQAFVLQYLASRKPHGGGGGAIRPTTGSYASQVHNTSTRSAEVIPVKALLQFLHEYSNGLIPQPRNERKRDRAALLTSSPPLPTAVSSSAHSVCAGKASAHGGTASPHRLYHRMLARHRLHGRDEDAEEWYAAQQQPQQHSEGKEGGEKDVPLTRQAASSHHHNNNSNSGSSSFLAAVRLPCAVAASPYGSPLSAPSGAFVVEKLREEKNGGGGVELSPRYSHCASPRSSSSH